MPSRSARRLRPMRGRLVVGGYDDAGDSHLTPPTHAPGPTPVTLRSCGLRPLGRTAHGGFRPFWGALPGGGEADVGRAEVAQVEHQEVELDHRPACRRSRRRRRSCAGRGRGRGAACAARRGGCPPARGAGSRAGRPGPIRSGRRRPRRCRRRAWRRSASRSPSRGRPGGPTVDSTAATDALAGRAPSPTRSSYDSGTDSTRALRPSGRTSTSMTASTDWSPGSQDTSSPPPGRVPTIRIVSPGAGGGRSPSPSKAPSMRPIRLVRLRLRTSATASPSTPSSVATASRRRSRGRRLVARAIEVPRPSVLPTLGGGGRDLMPQTGDGQELKRCWVFSRPSVMSDSTASAASETWNGSSLRSTVE